MASVERLQEDVHSILDTMRGFVEKASDFGWTPRDGILPVIRRAVLRRQFESLDVVAQLVAEKRGYAAAPLIRPSCEELIWIKYLNQIDGAAAEELMHCVAAFERVRSLKAQDDFGGRSATKALGLLPALKLSDHHREICDRRLGDLGVQLGWEPRTVQSRQLPSVRWLAKRTGQKDVYNFLYHATSRFVHFSATELLRRAWGRPGKMSIRSVHFGDYWGAFSLYWGFRLFLDSAIEILGTPGMPKEGVDEDTFRSAVGRFAEHGQVPIITAEELRWPE